MTLSKDQLDAKQTILDWINSRNRRSFITLGGYAGTGKSSLIAEVRKALPEYQIYTSDNQILLLPKKNRK